MAIYIRPKIGDLKVYYCSSRLFLKTNYYRQKILKDGTDPLCIICTKQQETIDHLVSGCSELPKKEYTQRHNKIAAYVHWGICKHYGIEVNDKYYERNPKTIKNSAGPCKNPK